MKRALLIVVLAILLAVLGAVLAVNTGMYHDTIQQKVSEAAGAKVQLGRVALLYRWPPAVEVGPSVVHHPLALVQWRSIEIELLKLSKPYFISVKIDRPSVEMQAASAPAAPKTQAGTGGGPAGQPPPFGLRVQVSKGEIKAPAAQVTELNMRFEQKLFLRSPAALHMDGSVLSEFLPVFLPVKVDSDALVLTADTVKSSGLSASLGGLQANVQGTSLLNDQRHRWLLDVAAKDLSKLPQPPLNLPAKNWRGAVNMKAELVKGGANQPWQADGEVHAEQVSADLAYKQNALQADGPFKLNLRAKFSYLGDKTSLPEVKGDLDLTQARVNYQGLLSKEPGVPMRAQVQATSDTRLKLDFLSMNLWDFAASVNGQIDLKTGWPAQLQFELKPVRLAGSEKILLPLKAQPVQGELALNGSLDGPLNEPMKARVILKTLQLRNFMAVADYDREGTLKLRGPVQANIQGSGEFADGQVRSAEGRGQVDLSGAALVAGPLRKEAKAKMAARFGVRNQAANVVIDELELNSFFGVLSAKGKLERKDIPVLDLNAEAKPLNLSELRIAMPDLHDVIPKGQLSGRFRIGGRLDLTKPWWNMPLLVSGQTDVRIPEYKMSAPAAATAGQAGAPQTPVQPTGFLNDGELTRRLKMNVKVVIDQFTKDTLMLSGLTTEGAIDGGKFTGQVQIGRIFGGAMTLKNLLVPLLDPKPVLQGSAAYSNLVIEDVLAFTKPEYKTMASGKASGTADFVTVMPSETDFMAKLKARGEVTAQPVTLNSVKVGQMINELTAKVPVLKLKPVKVDPLQGKAAAQFDLSGGILNLNNFNATDVDNSEVQMKGKANLTTMQGDFVGTFFWSQPQVKGCLLEGNSDAKGRMVIPLAIKGDLMNPGMNMLGDLLGKLGGKALECEQKKLVQKATDEGKQKLEKELKKTLKNILGK